MAIEYTDPHTVLGVHRGASRWEQPLHACCFCAATGVAPSACAELQHPAWHTQRLAACREEVKAAFRRAALACHPDVDHSPEAAARFARIKTAADVLLKGVSAACACSRLLGVALQRYRP